MVSVTSAMPSALRSRVPAKIRSCMCEPRSVFALCSPSTQVTPSRMFDFPHPFGPTTAAIPVPGTLTSVRSQKLLKPRMWIFFNLSIFTPEYEHRAAPVPACAAACCREWFGREGLSLIRDSTDPREQGQRPHGVFLWIRGGRTHDFGNCRELS